ncbi:MAG: diaminopimelate dehydrogenase [Chitinophagales bacterium]|nr:diaminopimelate dehydrogenase [Chitinophagales bacterium]
MTKIRVAIIGYGNIGKSVLDALQSASDFEVAGVVRRSPSTGEQPLELSQLEVVDDITKLKSVDVAIICSPSRKVSEQAKKILALGINTIDSFDIHTGIWDLRQELDPIAKSHQAVSIISAGWDPGSDSVIRALFLAMAPKGITYTNFGPGMSMGHTVAVKAIKGVKKALSMTIPTGTSIHRRMVYVEIEEGHDFQQISKAIKEDEYFSHDETHVTLVPSVDNLLDKGHGVNLVRKGVSGSTDNQLFEFNMKINNPSLTGQILVSCARASKRLTPGAYTMIEIPLIDLLEGSRESLIKSLV